MPTPLLLLSLCRRLGTSSSSSTRVWLLPGSISFTLSPSRADVEEASSDFFLADLALAPAPEPVPVPVPVVAFCSPARLFLFFTPDVMLPSLRLLLKWELERQPVDRVTLFPLTSFFNFPSLYHLCGH